MQKMAAGPTLERYALVTDEMLPLAKKLVSKDKANVQIPQGWCTIFADILLASS